MATITFTPPRQWEDWASWLLGFWLLLSPWILQVSHVWEFQRLRPAGVETGAPLRGDTTFHPAAVPFALHAFAVGYTLGPSLRELRAGSPGAVVARHAPEILAVGLVFGTLLVLGVRALARRGRLADFLLWTALPFAAVCYFAVRNFKVFHPRYLAVCMPALLMTLAAAFADRGRVTRIALGAAVAGLWGLSLIHLYFDPHYGKEDYRGAAALLAARGRAGEKVLALGAPDPVFYYYRGPLAAEPLWLGFAARPEWLADRMGRALAGAEGGWLVVSRSEDLDPRDAFGTFMATRFPDAERFTLEGVRVWHLDGRALARLASRG